MRTEIYLKIRERLEATGVIKHIDLWNHNVEFLEQEEAWARPAVFVEFGVITWAPVKGQECLRGSGTVRLHIVTDWTESLGTQIGDVGGVSVLTSSLPEDGTQTGESPVTAFGVADVVHGALAEMSGERFHGWELMETHTNHNHEDIVENIEVYKVRGARILQAE